MNERHYRNLFMMGFADNLYKHGYRVSPWMDEDEQAIYTQGYNTASVF